MLAAWLLALAGCGGDLDTVPGSALRVAIDPMSGDSQLQVEVLSADDCDTEQFAPEDCYPRVLRSVEGDHGEVRVAFRIRADGEPFPIRLGAEQLEVYHMKRGVSDVELIPRGPMDANQLYILVIDGSGSMGLAAEEGKRQTRMNRVKKALMQPSVVRRFFPKGNTYTGVALLQFTSGDPFWVGEGPEIVTNSADYLDKVQNELDVRGGYTHLYNAVRYATGNLLKQEDIQGAVDGMEATPTVVVLTDGFNNLEADDQCQDNAPLLTKLLGQIKLARTGRNTKLRARPTVFTVGLGRPTWPNYKLPDKLVEVVDGPLLCRGKVGAYIDGRGREPGLEDEGIDNASLMWIADAGGGESYVRTERKGLGEAFAAAAAQRYRWFELRYRVAPAYLRRSFQTRVKLSNYKGANGVITFHPSAWFDPPTATTSAEGRAVPTPLRASLALLLPILGGLLGITFFGAASYNVRRAIFRGRPRNPKPG